VSAEAEADAQYLSTYGVHTPVVASTYHHGVGHSVVAPAVHSVAAPISTYSHSVATPVVSSYSNILNRGVYGLNHGVYGLNRGVYSSALGGHYYGKREAEAEPEADAQHYASTYAYGVHAPVAYNVAPVATVAHSVAPVVSSTYSAAVPALHTVAAPISTYSHSVAAPVSTYSHSIATPVVSRYSNILNRGVYSLNRGVYGSALGGHYYGKREAEAEPEADAQYYASTYAHGVHAPVVASAYHHGAAHSVAPIATVAHSVAPVVTSAYRAVLPAVYNTGVYGLNRGVYGLNSGIYGSAYNGYPSVGYTGNYYG